MFGLRLGLKPRCMATTTPKPVKLIRELVAQEGVHVTRASSYDNRLNLASSFLGTIVKKYEGTRLGRQELNAEILEDIPGALWNRGMFDAPGMRIKELPDLVKVVVAVDPAVTSGEDSDETGIVVVGVDRAGFGYVLDDLSGRYTPVEWAQRVVAA